MRALAKGVMPSKQKPQKLIVTVLLANGKKVNHTYYVPLDPKEAIELVNHMAELIAMVMTHRKETYLYLMNPSISYNPDYVLAVRFNASGVTELEEAIEKAQTRMGFIKD
ncbi:hypothetical protein ACFLXT_01540 [Chloroflexota bacterium]